MPQLDRTTYFRQVTTIMTVFTVLYRLIRSEILPPLSYLVKLRIKKLVYTKSICSNYAVEQSEAESNYNLVLLSTLSITIGLFEAVIQHQQAWVMQMIQNTWRIEAEVGLLKQSSLHRLITYQINSYYK